MSRSKTGGRKLGTPNKRTASVEEKLAALGCDPIQGMAKIAMDESVDVGIRAHMLKELAQYVAPKRKAIEMSGPGNEPFSLSAAVEGAIRMRELDRRRLHCAIGNGSDLMHVA